MSFNIEKTKFALVKIFKNLIHFKIVSVTATCYYNVKFFLYSL